jgi:hypothetical protein
VKPKEFKVLVDLSIIEQASERLRFSVPDVSGATSVNKRLALFHCRNGKLVFAIITDVRDLANR